MELECSKAFEEDGFISVFTVPFLKGRFRRLAGSALVAEAER